MANFFEEIECIDYGILHYADHKSNKLWGHFETKEHLFACWWCAVGANPNFKVFGQGIPWGPDVQTVRRLKIKNKYKSIDLNELQTMVPNIDDMLMSRWTLHKLIKLS